MKAFKHIAPLLVGLFIMAHNGIAQQQLTPEERVFGLSKLWQEANYNFAYFDQVPHLNWDSLYTATVPKVLQAENDFEYYKILEQLTAQLQDGHTNIYFPEHIEAELSYPMVEVKVFNNKFIITNLCESLKKKLPLGSEISTVNQQPVEQYFNDKVLTYMASSSEHGKQLRGLEYFFYGQKSEPIHLEIHTPSGITTSITLSRNFADYHKWLMPKKGKTEAFQHQVFKHNIHYVALNSFHDEEGVIAFKNKLNKLERASGLIIDIRENGGGQSNMGLEIAQHLVQEDYLIDSKWKSRSHIASHKAWGTSELQFMGYNPIPELENFGNMDAWIEVEADTIQLKPNIVKLNMPIVLLTSGKTASAAEDFLVNVSNQTHIVKMGETTFGSTGQPIYFSLPGGGHARVCAKRDMYPNGDEFVGIGIRPDIEIIPTLESTLNQTDLALKQAKEYLQNAIASAK